MNTNPSIEAMLNALLHFGKVEISERGGRYVVRLAEIGGDQEIGDCPTLHGAIGTVYHLKRDKIAEASRIAAVDLNVFHAAEGAAPVQ